MVWEVGGEVGGESVVAMVAARGAAAVGRDRRSRWRRRGLDKHTMHAGISMCTQTV